MNRRELLKWIGLAPVLPVVASLPVVAAPVARVIRRDTMRIGPNAKLAQFTREINREYVRENLFAPHTTRERGVSISKAGSK